VVLLAEDDLHAVVETEDGEVAVTVEDLRELPFSSECPRLIRAFVSSEDLLRVPTSPQVLMRIEAPDVVPSRGRGRLALFGQDLDGAVRRGPQADGFVFSSHR
jgi:hypothetical protein